jgi:hypothetical protein
MPSGVLAPFRLVSACPTPERGDMDSYPNSSCQNRVCDVDVSLRPGFRRSGRPYRGVETGEVRFGTPGSGSSGSGVNHPPLLPISLDGRAIAPGIPHPARSRYTIPDEPTRLAGLSENRPDPVAGRHPLIWIPQMGWSMAPRWGQNTSYAVDGANVSAFDVCRMLISASTPTAR